jgi:MFS family permease
MDEAHRRVKMYYGWWIVILLGYTLLHTGGHGFYSGAVYMPLIVESLGITLFAFTAAGTVWAIVFGLSSPLIGGWIQRYGARRVFILGLCAGGAVGLAFSFVTEVWHLMVINLAAGVTAAATILVPSQTVITDWFDRYRGRAMALAMMGIGFGGALIPELIGWLVEMNGWRFALRIGAVLNFLIVLPPIVLFLKNKPSDVGQHVDGLEPGTDEAASAGQPTGVTAGRAMRSTNFAFILAVYLLQLFVMSGVQMNTQTFAMWEIGYPLRMALRFFAFALWVTIPMRFLVGYLCDRIDPKYAMATSGLFLAGGSTILWFGMINFEWTGYGPILLFAVVQGIAIAANAIGLPILVGRCFGERDFPKIMGLVMTSFAVGVFFGPNTMSLIYGKMDSYELAFQIATAAALLSVLAALLIRTKALHEEFTTGGAGWNST